MMALTIQVALKPQVITTLGFQLSYLAMTGITVLYPRLAAWYPDGFSLAARRIWQGAALAVSCQIFTAPLVWIRFHSFPKYFILTNLLALPMTSALMAASIATLTLQAFGACPPFLVYAVDLLASSLLFTLGVISSL
jgi:competence protein ComEC